MARSFHFTTDPSSLWTEVNLINSAVWTQSGTLLNASGSANAEVLYVRDTDTSNNATVEARQRFDTWNINFQGFGVICNQQPNKFYLFVWVRSGGGDTVRLFTFNSGYTQNSSASKAYTPNTFARMKITSTDNGANKDLEGFVDGVSETTGSTVVQFTGGQGGVYVRLLNTADDMDIDWWAMDLNIAVTSVVPSTGLEAGGQSVDILGSDIGDGSIGEFGGVNATNNVASPNTSLTCDTPSLAAGLVDVRVKFGTLGSEEYSGILTDGYLYIAVVTPATQAILMGVDITQFVTSWGRIEQIKDVLLAQATLLTTQMTIQVFNADKFLKPRGVGSLIGGLNWYDRILELKKDGVTLYEGFIKDIRPNSESGTANIVSENVLKKPAETVIVTQATAANPSQTMLALLRLVLDDDKINVSTFDQAGARATAAGATIDYTFTQNDGVTVLQAIQLISELSSISVFVIDNRIVARPFIPYQGSEAGLKFELNDSIVREWGDFSFDTSSFNNRVSVGYPTDQSFVLTDPEAIKKDDIIREFPFPADEKVVATNLTSARFFGRLYLQRASKRRAKLSVAMGKEAKGVRLGDRFPVTAPDLGLVRFPMECIEVHPTFDTDETELALAQIFEI